MSESMGPPGHEPSSAPPPPGSPRDAKAELKAAKAYSKAQRPWYKKKRWILSLGFILLIVAVSAGSSGGGGTDNGGGGDTSAGSSGGGDKEQGKSGSVGQPLQNAGTTYEVTSATTAATIGEQEFGSGAKADGQFVVVELTLTNNKDETKTFSDSSAKLVTTDGKKYETSSDAIFAVEDSLILKDIQPDLTTKGTLVFDVPPAKVAGSKLVVEDLFGSGEITVALGL